MNSPSTACWSSATAHGSSKRAPERVPFESPEGLSLAHVERRRARRRTGRGHGARHLFPTHHNVHTVERKRKNSEGSANIGRIRF
ncbi:hypothetical protein FVF58_01695 [Paraburkholderia panacisoli]|uniref:Uncharacterized protein n=1 Tax=Paraburkholderia panacisoli TaxID=2603818 RepID=A0A5B0HLH1_9BURK|nr:hypothetical protein FVF58_01695 [Paraburkholderia panacisoli]